MAQTQANSQSITYWDNMNARHQDYQVVARKRSTIGWTEQSCEIFHTPGSGLGLLCIVSDYMRTIATLVTGIAFKKGFYFRKEAVISYIARELAEGF